MAKGRKLTTSRSERFLGSYGYSHDQSAVGNVSEIGEEDLRSMVEDMVNGGDDQSIDGACTTKSNGNMIISGRRHVHRDDRQVSGLSLAFDDSDKTSSPRIVHQFPGSDSVAISPRGRHMAMSAPVNVPDWSTIYRVDSVESLHDSDDGADCPDSEMIPPHEYLAREYARSRKSAANSVFEGVGRTLKGRDMSRVRDAVWGQTGFNG